MKNTSIVRLASLSLVLGLVACGSDDAGSAAQRAGIGGACKTNADCADASQTCLPFKGGYCGKVDCVKDADCPSGSACVAHTDGKNYCFLVCAEKAACNVNRPADVEANCSSSVTFADKASAGKKACVPPS